VSCLYSVGAYRDGKKRDNESVSNYFSPCLSQAIKYSKYFCIFSMDVHSMAWLHHLPSVWPVLAVLLLLLLLLLPPLPLLLLIILIIIAAIQHMAKGMGCGKSIFEETTTFITYV
jgi:hypothetical protein